MMETLHPEALLIFTECYLKRFKYKYKIKRFTNSCSSFNYCNDYKSYVYMDIRFDPRHPYTKKLIINAYKNKEIIKIVWSNFTGYFIIEEYDIDWLGEFAIINLHLYTVKNRKIIEYL